MASGRLAQRKSRVAESVAMSEKPESVAVARVGFGARVSDDVVAI